MTLLAGGMLSTLIRAFKIIDNFWSLPYKWCPVTQSFKIVSKSRTLFNKIRLFIAYTDCFLIIVQMTATWVYDNILVKTYCVMCVSVIVMMLSGSHLNYQQPEFLISLLNSMVNYEKRRLHEQDGLRSREKSSGFLKFMIMYNAVSVLFPIPYFFNTVLNPCLPSYVGSFLLLDQCEAKKLGYPPDVLEYQLGMKIFVAFIALWNWQYMMPGMGVHLCLMYVQGNCFVEYIMDYGRKMSGLKDINTSELDKVTPAFREMQVMIVNHRYLNAKLVIVAFLVSGVASEITALYNCIALDMPTQMFNFSLWTAMVNASTFVFAYGCLANVYQASLESKEAIAKNTKLMSNRWFRRYARSCPILKISFGSGSYLDALTPLVTQEFVMDNTVSLLLMG